MSADDLLVLYRDYIDALNRRDLPALDQFVREDITYNGERIGLAGYREMLRRNVRDIPDLHFRVEIAVADATYVASRLAFECTPKGDFLGLPINGRRIRFSENVFYRFGAGRIEDVRSVIDKVAIEKQL